MSLPPPIATNRRTQCATDGPLSQSAMTGQPCITLFTPAADALPHTPAFSEPLTHPGLATPLATAALDIGYRTLS